MKISPVSFKARAFMAAPYYSSKNTKEYLSKKAKQYDNNDDNSFVLTINSRSNANGYLTDLWLYYFNKEGKLISATEKDDYSNVINNSDGEIHKYHIDSLFEKI